VAATEHNPSVCMKHVNKTLYIRNQDGTFVGGVSVLKLWVMIAFILSILVGGFYFTFKARSTAQGQEVPLEQTEAKVNVTELCTKTKEGYTDCTDIQTRLRIYELTEGGKKPIKWYKNTVKKVVTAYNSIPEQTDATPEIAANGENIMRLYEKGDLTCAASMPFGTKLEVPGFGTCVVRDRLAKKYSDRVDIHMGKDIASAWKWGKRTLEVSVLK